MAARLKFMWFFVGFTLHYILSLDYINAVELGSQLSKTRIQNANIVDILRLGNELMKSEDLDNSVYHLCQKDVAGTLQPLSPINEAVESEKKSASKISHAGDQNSASGSKFVENGPVKSIHKREVEDTLPSPAPPLKKANQNEKKPSTKSPPVGDADKKSVTEESVKVNASDTTSSSTNSTEVNTTVSSKKSLKDKSMAALNYSTTATPPGVASTTAIPKTSSLTSVLPSSTSIIQSTTVEDIPPTMPSNVTNTTVDYHVYYNSSFYLEKEAMAYWVDFDEVPRDKVVMHDMLSDSHRRAATVTLSFDFPFYGHLLRNITIATGGFLYMGDYMHSWLAATQYVAPLMANFDTSLSNESAVRYFDNGTAFVIEWDEVSLQDGRQGGRFSFQATLMKNGNIVFVYNSIPVSVTEIGDEYHPVKVGLSDAYVIDRVIYFIRRKTIYEYHRIDMKRERIGNHTAIYFTALTTCLDFKDCESCIGAEIELHCIWCETAKRCSDGLDRQRQDWLQLRCDVEKNSVNCSSLTPGKVNPYMQPFTDSPFRTYTVRPPPDNYPHSPDSAPFQPRLHDDDEVVAHHVQGQRDGALGVGGVVSILLLLGIILGAGAWVSYAYRNPHTSSGQLLIRYRPSQWRFKSGEARYTAASVHM